MFYHLGLPEEGKGACSEDRGGPLVTKATGDDAGYSLIGVVSRPKCGHPGDYDVYAEFSHFLGWVKEQFSVESPLPAPSPAPAPTY